MAKKSEVKSQNGSSSTEKPSVDSTKTNSKSFEKSVIKNLENSRLRIKPWILQLFGALFILLGLVFIVYPLISDRVSFNLPDVFDRDNEVSEEQEDQGNNDNEGENNQEEEAEGEEEDDGEIAGGESARQDTSSTDASRAKAQTTANLIEQTGKWRATDYVTTDIKPGSYEVKLGDTLWEISEAVYGSGHEWRKILSNNSSSIGFLPDGSQALIVPGQILTIS